MRNKKLVGLLGLFASFALALSVLTVGGTPAEAMSGKKAKDNLPVYPDVYASASLGAVSGSLRVLGVFIDTEIPDTTVELTLFGCDGIFVNKAKKTSTGFFSVSTDNAVDVGLWPLGKTTSYRYTLSAPGYQSVTHNKTIQNKPAQSCEGWAPPKLYFTTYRVGKVPAVVGKRVYATSLMDTNGNTSYKWKLNGKTVKAGKNAFFFKPTKAMKGKKLKLKMRVTLRHNKPIVWTYNFGKVKLKK